MDQGEIGGLGQVTGEALARNVATVRGVHQAVARRVFGALGPVAMPVRVAHDGIAGGIYKVLEGTHQVLPRALASSVVLATREKPPRISDSKFGNVALGILNGVRGDRLARTGNELALPMTFTRGEGAVGLAPTELAAAFPDATPRLAVFAHGLCETDRSWFDSDRTEEGTETAYGLRLYRDLGYTPLYLRYNSGLHVSDNGRTLAALLTEVVNGWPCPVEEIALIGHSMGGLVVRSACHQAAENNSTWTGLVRHVFCLATPHLGSHVEQGANVVGWALDRLPETRPFATSLKSRSAGIKDLRFGSCLESDWRGQDPDEFLKNRCGEVPFLPTANYYFVGVTVTRNAHHPLGLLLGDLLVRFSSASGSGLGRVLPFEIDKGRHMGGLHHFHLLNHPDVYEQLRHWLDGANAGREDETGPPAP